jgi:hypothetical protein
MKPRFPNAWPALGADRHFFPPAETAAIEK